MLPSQSSIFSVHYQIVHVVERGRSMFQYVSIHPLPQGCTVHSGHCAYYIFTVTAHLNNIFLGNYRATNDIIIGYGAERFGFEILRNLLL